MDAFSVTTIVGMAAFLAGIVFGATAQRTNFCTMGALSDAVFMGDYRRFRSWMLAVAVAIAGSQAMHLAGLVDLGRSIYLTPNLGWAGAILGGLLFGFGMTMAGGCGNKCLVRIGGGNLKSIIVFLVLGLFAYMTMRGLIALARVELEAATNLDLAAAGLSTQGLPDMLTALTGLPAEASRLLLAALAVLGLLFWCFKSPEFRASPRDIIGGVIIGAMVPTAWWITGVLGNDDFDPQPLASFTFVGPIGEAMQYLMSFTGATISFGVAAVGGVIAGSFLMALATRSFRLESFTNTDDMLRHLSGAAMMGTGGVLALGCTIGQGLSGLSTLALGSVIALLSILAGGYLGLKYLEEGSLGGAFRAVFTRTA
ncbi:YeeE/YedE family protein [Telmatospirillum sp. J64-1]|uniref:YeeE/YedE family protein n=1 Tax=Telmatospirillum sp. J64-1 TaxID=2502183 RepID=UPI002107D47B|nr:YeeE/YedE family protein [Telmatospirillum sp. J64-1]